MRLSLESKNWKEFFLKDIFHEIQRGKRLKKDDHKTGDKPYVSSTSLNNGLDGFVGNERSIRVFENCLTIANSGSVGSVFFHPYKFVASDHVTKLKNENYSKYVYQFISCLVGRLGKKYSFNREINDKRIQREKILLPVDSKGCPDYKFMEVYMRQKEEEKLDKYKQFVSKRLRELKNYKEVEPLEGKVWGEFRIEDIFEVKSGVRLTKANMKAGKKPFIGAIDNNNGISEYVSNSNRSEDSNVLGVNYNGSVVENFYHPYTALFTDDVKRLSFRQIKGNKHQYLFVKTQILKQKAKYQYGYKFNARRMNRQRIMLPMNKENEPDYEYMENCMKQLEYRKLMKYLNAKSL